MLSRSWVAESHRASKYRASKLHGAPSGGCKPGSLLRGSGVAAEEEDTVLFPGLHSPLLSPKKSKWGAGAPSPSVTSPGLEPTTRERDASP